MRWPAPSTARWLILIGLLAFWELMPRTRIIPELFLPSLSKTITVLYTDRYEYVEALGVTIYEVAIAMVFACGAGILVGALVAVRNTPPTAAPVSARHAEFDRA